MSVNTRTLSEVLVGHDTVLDVPLRESVARLMEAGLVTFRRVAQDGRRVGASVGAVRCGACEVLDDHGDPSMPGR